jgi:hypothetical protein
MIEVGRVTAIVGIEITIRANEGSNLETHNYQGEAYKRKTNPEYVSIAHGFREIICLVEGEYLDERLVEGEGPSTEYVRKLKARPVGFFEDDRFQDGIKFLPKIDDPVFLLPQRRVEAVFEKRSSSGLVMGRLLKEDLPISLPWQDLFNTHIGIFGNTGSGKSNTLAKLYTSLFDMKIDGIAASSKFIFLDFNGEYTGSQLVGPDNKQITRLRTKGEADGFFGLSASEFWDAETLGILFQATQNTQKPFLRRIVTGRNKYAHIDNSLSLYLRSTFDRVLRSKDPSLEALEQLRHLARTLDSEGTLISVLDKVGVQRGRDVESFHYIATPGNWRWLATDEDFVQAEFLDKLDELDVQNLNGFDELQVRASLQIIRDAHTGSVQYEHIHPLLRRIDSLKGDLSKVIEVGEGEGLPDLPITVISLRETKQEVKKILPILIAKHYYESHKNTVSSPPETTAHLVIDEAHNILSTQSTREAESWKDYRLELFEEIIKEGRKFGFYVTLASQRPSDISPTIVSQIHNYFIHRLVNDRDLALLDNAISTLDTVSRSQIPTLPKGACVVTGTTFDIPMLLQVEKLLGEREPDSRDVDLSSLWS